MVLNITAGGMSKEDVEQIKKQQLKLAKKLEKETLKEFKQLKSSNFDPSPEHIRSKIKKIPKTIVMREDVKMRLEAESKRTGKRQARIIEELIFEKLPKEPLEDNVYDQAFLEAKQEVIEIQEIVKLYNLGFTAPEVAKELDVHEAKVWRIIRDLGLKTQDTRRLEDEAFKDEVVDLYYDGFTNPEIARELKCSLPLVSKILRERKPDPKKKRAYKMREERRKQHPQTRN